jgi:multidrug efflux pump subunit AcrA (membrane-fusion protein)
MSPGHLHRELKWGQTQTPFPVTAFPVTGLRLVSGMPVETFVQTGERTVMSYLVKPLHDQIMKAFRER